MLSNVSDNLLSASHSAIDSTNLTDILPGKEFNVVDEDDLSLADYLGEFLSDSAEYQAEEEDQEREDHSQTQECKIEETFQSYEIRNKAGLTEPQEIQKQLSSNYEDQRQKIQDQCHYQYHYAGNNKFQNFSEGQKSIDREFQKSTVNYDPLIQPIESMQALDNQSRETREPINKIVNYTYDLLDDGEVSNMITPPTPQGNSIYPRNSCKVKNIYQRQTYRSADSFLLSPPDPVKDTAKSSPLYQGSPPPDSPDLEAIGIVSQNQNQGQTPHDGARYCMLSSAMHHKVYRPDKIFEYNNQAHLCSIPRYYELPPQPPIPPTLPPHEPHEPPPFELPQPYYNENTTMLAIPSKFQSEKKKIFWIQRYQESPSPSFEQLHAHSQIPERYLNGAEANPLFDTVKNKPELYDVLASFGMENYGGALIPLDKRTSMDGKSDKDTAYVWVDKSDLLFCKVNLRRPNAWTRRTKSQMENDRIKKGGQSRKKKAPEGNRNNTGKTRTSRRTKK